MIYNDPGLVWPVIPVLNERVQLFYDNGVVIYGGTKGPFKVNGSKVFFICNELFKLLENNKIEKKIHSDFIKKISESEFSNELIYFYNMLYQNGCLCILSNSLEEKYWSNLNSYTKNYSSFREINDHRKLIKISFNSTNKLAKDVKEFLQSRDILVDNKNYNWRLVQVTSDKDISNLDIDKKNILIFKTTDGIVLGPVISRDAISKEHGIDLFNQFEIVEPEFDSSLTQLVSLVLYKYIMKLSEYFFDRYFLKITGSSTSYESVYDYIDINNLNVIQEFELKSGFPATEYNNRKSHLTHYKSKNLKLAKVDYSSTFWKIVDDDNITKDLHVLFDVFAGFKKNNDNKKYVPTGGNLNSNMLFFVNLNPNYLDGEGIYFFENTKSRLYQVSNDISMFKKEDKDNNDGIILMGRNIDTIAEKYGDFSFKIGNLNLGVILATYALIKDSFKEKFKLQLLAIPSESLIRNHLGMELTNVLFKYGIGVKFND